MIEHDLDKNDSEQLGDEDLSYVSGDERDFNELVQDLKMQNVEYVYKNL